MPGQQPCSTDLPAMTEFARPGPRTAGTPRDAKARQHRSRWLHERALGKSFVKGEPAALNCGGLVRVSPSTGHGSAKWVRHLQSPQHC